MTDKQPALNGEQSARRKLVRGVFGVPAAMALYSGSARANSSILTCIVNRNNTPQTLPVVTTPDAIYLRYQLWAFVNVANGTIRADDGYWLKGSELDAFNRLGKTHWLGTNWQRFDIATNRLGAMQSFVPVSSAGASLNFELRKVAYWVALRVDSEGRLVGAGASGTGSAVNASCWNSFAMGSPA